MLQVASKEMKTNEKKTFTVGAGYTLLATGLLKMYVWTFVDVNIFTVLTDSV